MWIRYFLSRAFPSTLTLALGKAGNGLWSRVGREASGSAFNSNVQLEYEKGLPRNSFVNTGAIVVTDCLLVGHQPREVIGEIQRFVRFLAADEAIFIDQAFAASEKASGFRNIALANYIHAFGNPHHESDRVLSVYFHHCAIAMTCRQFAAVGIFLAAGQRKGTGGYLVVSVDRARRINALMLTCGHYEGSGDFAFRIGLPAKSGVGGNILAIVPCGRNLSVDVLVINVLRFSTWL